MGAQNDPLPWPPNALASPDLCMPFRNESNLQSTFPKLHASARVISRIKQRRKKEALTHIWTSWVEGS
jgi:hypothetical protein